MDLNSTDEWTGKAAGIQITAAATFAKLEATRNGVQVDVRGEVFNDSGEDATVGAILTLPGFEPFTAVQISSGGKATLILHKDNAEA